MSVDRNQLNLRTIALIEAAMASTDDDEHGEELRALLQPEDVTDLMWMLTDLVAFGATSFNLLCVSTKQEPAALIEKMRSDVIDRITS